MSNRYFFKTAGVVADDGALMKIVDGVADDGEATQIVDVVADDGFFLLNISATF